MRSLLFIAALILGLAAVSCINDDFDYSPSHDLSFSRDTVGFGTLFTGEGSPTARLLVHNRHKKGVVISSIRILQEQPWFTFNVDGVSGSEFRDVEIRGEDSIYVYIECLVPESASRVPELVSAQMEFVTNGNVQDVELEALAVNVERLHGTVVTGELTLDDSVPYVVYDTLRVAPGGVLRMTAGAQVLFHDGAHLRVEGRLEAVGEVGRPVELRGDRLDNVLPNVPYDLLAGQWDGVSIAPGSYGNRMEYVDMRSTVSGLRLDSCGDVSQRKLLLLNSWLHNSQTSVLDSRYAWADAMGCCFSDAPRGVVVLEGGRHSMVQCTVANYYLFAAVTGANLTLRHCLPEHAADNNRPLMQASFENGILYGLGSSISPGDLTGSAVYLRNMLLKEKITPDDNFIDCIGGEDPLFYTVRSDYYFNYRLRPDSPAIGMGNPEFVTPLCLHDMDGLDRLSDGLPALGAYVYAPPAE